VASREQPSHLLLRVIGGGGGGSWSGVLAAADEEWTLRTSLVYAKLQWVVLVEQEQDCDEW